MKIYKITEAKVHTYKRITLVDQDMRYVVYMEANSKRSAISRLIAGYKPEVDPAPDAG